ncbi:MAG: aminoglycoside phosphotransferase family protein [Acidimicrobiales bacterium]|nr:aminoglycoside phosphotransferase family protein [Acidimicrobiales bacterium]
MGDASAIPASLPEITAEWLSTEFGASGHDVTVSNVDYAAMGGIVGAVGHVGILTLDYDGPTTLPRQMVGKCPLDDDVARLINDIMGMYPRESGFFAHLVDDVPMRIPTCYVNTNDSEAGRFLQLFEYIEGRDGDILAGAPFDAMLKLITDLGTMHGQFWEAPVLDRHDWLYNWRRESLLAGIPVMTEGWSKLRAQQPDAMPDELWAVIDETYVQNTKDFLELFAQRPATFVHGDYELDNMIFTDDDIAVLDWQTTMRSFPGFDVGWFLACSADDASIAREAELIEAYRTALEAAGGPRWSTEELLDDCAIGMLYHVSGAGYTNTQDMSGYGGHAPRMEARFARMLSGVVDASVRWDVAARLRRLL